MFFRLSLFFVACGFAQTSPNFALSPEHSALSLVAGGTANLTVQLAVPAGYTQPVYLLSGPLPEGIGVKVPSPVVGGQKLSLAVSAAPQCKPMNFVVSIYGSSYGETHTFNFSVALRPREEPSSAPAPSAGSALPPSSGWVAAWGASAVTPSNDSGAYYLTNVTVRQIAHLSIGASARLRLRLSNALGKEPVVFGSIHAAQWAGDADNVTSAIVESTDQIVTFGKSKALTIPAGAEVFSDPIALPLPAGSDLAVSFYIPRHSNVPATMHTFGNQTAYFSFGDFAGNGVLPNAVTDTVRPYLTGVDVDAPEAAAVVALGDSLTDGMLSSLNRNLRWTDDLARKLNASFGGKVSVVNAGITGNCLTMSCFGPSMLERFKRDVLEVSGVKYLIVLAGVNDIGNAKGLTAPQLIAAYREMVALAHARRIVVYGGTVTPFGGSHYFSAEHERLRQQVNGEIRGGGIFDGFVDFDKAVANPANPAYLLAGYDGDKIRPNDAGYRAMADAIDTGLLKP